jgi:hypothetical protein
MAARAAVMGLMDVFGDEQIRNLHDAWLHAGGNILAVLIELYNWYSRYPARERSRRPNRADLVFRRGADPVF